MSAADVVTVTRDTLVEAFTEWERRYREEPERFLSDYQRFTQSAESYGEGATRTLLGYITEVGPVSDGGGINSGAGKGAR